MQGNATGLRLNIVDNASLVFDQAFIGTFAGVISGTGALTKTGGAPLVLTGANSFSGGTTINGGSLWFVTDSVLGAPGAPITFSGPQGLILAATNKTPGGTINRPLNLLSANGGGISVELNDLIWSGVISGPGILSKLGPGNLTLTGANTHSGGTVVKAGTLFVTSDANLGAAGSPLSLENSNSSLVTTAGTPANTVFNRPLNLVQGAIVVQLHPIEWSGVISGPGKLGKRGMGVLKLTGANTYSGGTSVSNGVLWVTSDAALGAAGGGVSLSGDSNGNTATLRTSQNFATSRPVSLKGRSSISVDPSFTLTLNGVVSGETLAKADNGTLVLNGANTYSNTVIQGGTLIGNATSIRGGITNSAAVIFDQGSLGAYAGNLTGPGSLTKRGAGDLKTTGKLQAGGNTFVNAGTLSVNGSLTSPTITVDGPTSVLGGNGVITGKTVVTNGGRIESSLRHVE